MRWKIKLEIRVAQKGLINKFKLQKDGTGKVHRKNFYKCVTQTRESSGRRSGV